MKNWKYIDGAKVGNALKYTNLEEAKKMCRQINDSLAPDAALRHYCHVYEKDGAYYVMETGEATAKGMKRVGNDTPAEYFSKKPKVIGNEKTGAEGFFKQLSDDVKEREDKDDENIEKVGNLSKDELLKELDAEEKLLKVLKERGGEKGYGTTPILYRDAKRRIQDIKNKLKQIGNSKVGNATYDMTDRDYENEYKSLVQKRNNVQKGTKEYEEVQKRLAEIREKLGRSPFGNKIGNSAYDDKFAYVMREFDEGKLKTPDGKVVTDPAQAKAIAYSESKKTENGLARARNAIKKS